MSKERRKINNSPTKLTPYILAHLGENSNTLILETARGESRLNLEEVKWIQMILRIYLMSMDQVIEEEDIDNTN